MTKIIALSLCLGLAILILGACGDDQNGGATPTAIGAEFTKRAAITVIVAPTSTPTPIVALLPTDTPLPFGSPEVGRIPTNTPNAKATAAAKTVLTPQIASTTTPTFGASTPTITPILPTPKKLTPAPGTNSPTTAPTKTTQPPAGGGAIGDVQELNTLKTTKISFLSAYRQAAKAVAAVQPNAKIVLAQANYFTATRTGWSFFFVWPQGSKMYVATFDSASTNITINDSQSPILLQDAGQIQMEKVLDTPALIAKVEAAGIAPSTPIDSVSFERYGTPPVPAYSCVNGVLQKELIINAYTGQVIKNDFNS